MHKRGFMLAIGIPLAREDPGEHDDEYKLGPREHDSSDEQQRPHDALDDIFHGICDGDEQMRQVALTLGSCGAWARRRIVTSVSIGIRSVANYLMRSTVMAAKAATTEGTTKRM